MRRCLRWKQILETNVNSNFVLYDDVIANLSFRFPTLLLVYIIESQFLWTNLKKDEINVQALINIRKLKMYLLRLWLRRECDPSFLEEYWKPLYKLSKGWWQKGAGRWFIFLTLKPPSTPPPPTPLHSTSQHNRQTRILPEYPLQIIHKVHSTYRWNTAAWNLAQILKITQHLY